MSHQKRVDIWLHCLTKNQGSQTSEVSKFKVFDVFLHPIVKRLERLIEEKIYIKIRLKSTIPQPFSDELCFSWLSWTYKGIEITVYCENEFFRSLGVGKIIVAALHKMLIQTVFSSQDVGKCILQRLPKMINSITEIGTRKLSRISNRKI